MKNILLTGVCASFLIMQFGVSFAQDGGAAYDFAPKKHIMQGEHGKKHKGMKAADTNGDGQIDRAEFMAHRNKKAEERFDRIDTDGDGVISKEEHRAKRAQMKQRRHKRREGGQSEKRYGGDE